MIQETVSERLASIERRAHECLSNPATTGGLHLRETGPIVTSSEEYWYLVCIGVKNDHLEFM